MRVLTFKPRFAELVANGRKCCTIRRRARCKPGDELSLREWTGLPYRSKQRELRPPVRCMNVQPITLTCKHERLAITINGQRKYADDVATADGFANADEMREFFQTVHSLPFEGELIEWE